MAKPSPGNATVIGGHGYIGHHLQARLQQDGRPCWVPQRDDPLLWQRELGQVFYCAGLTADYAERPHDAIEAHVSLLSRVLRDASFDSLVYLSSTRLYDSLSFDGANNAAVETQALRLSPEDPRHLYDLSKALGESLCRVSGRGRARVARLSCVWGDSDDATGFLPDLIRRTRELCTSPAQDPILIDSSPHFMRDYVHIDDVLTALIALASPQQRAEFSIYNVAGGRNVSNAELFAMVSKACGRTLSTTHERVSGPMPRISIQRMAQEFGWRPADTLGHLNQILQRVPT